MADTAAWRAAFGSANLGEKHELSGLHWQGKYRITSELPLGAYTVVRIPFSKKGDLTSPLARRIR